MTKNVSTIIPNTTGHLALSTFERPDGSFAWRVERFPAWATVEEEGDITLIPMLQDGFDDQPNTYVASTLRAGGYLTVHPQGEPIPHGGEDAACEDAWGAWVARCNAIEAKQKADRDAIAQMDLLTESSAARYAPKGM